MVIVADITDDLGHIGFNAGRARKRAARMLAAKLDKADTTELLNWLLDEKIKKYFPDEMRLIEAESKKRRPLRTGEEEAASSR